jgi:hypothetical protein
MFGNLLFVDIDPETGDTISTSMTVRFSLQMGEK